MASARRRFMLEQIRRLEEGCGRDAASMQFFHNDLIHVNGWYDPLKTLEETGLSVNQEHMINESRRESTSDDLEPDQNSRGALPDLASTLHGDFRIYCDIEYPRHVVRKSVNNSERSGNNYTAVNITDQATAVLGDVEIHNHHYHPSESVPTHSVEIDQANAFVADIMQAAARHGIDMSRPPAPNSSIISSIQQWINDVVQAHVTASTAFELNSRESISTDPWSKACCVSSLSLVNEQEVSAPPSVKIYNDSIVSPKIPLQNCDSSVHEDLHSSPAKPELVETSQMASNTFSTNVRIRCETTSSTPSNYFEVERVMRLQGHVADKYVDHSSTLESPVLLLSLHNEDDHQGVGPTRLTNYDNMSELTLQSQQHETHANTVDEQDEFSQRYILPQMPFDEVRQELG